MSSTLTDDERAIEISRVCNMIRSEGGAVENMLLDEIEHLRRRRDTAKRAMGKARQDVRRKEEIIVKQQIELRRLRSCLGMQPWLSHEQAEASSMPTETDAEFHERQNRRIGWSEPSSLEEAATVLLDALDGVDVTAHGWGPKRRVALAKASLRRFLVGGDSTDRERGE